MTVGAGPASGQSSSSWRLSSALGSREGPSNALAASKRVESDSKLEKYMMINECLFLSGEYDTAVVVEDFKYKDKGIGALTTFNNSKREIASE